MKITIAFLSAGVLTSVAASEVLFDNLYITDGQLYCSASSSCIGGYCAHGYNSDLQVADDFVVPDDAPYLLTDMTGDYVGPWAGGYNDVFIEVFEDIGGVPSEVAMYAGIFGVDITEFDDTVFDMHGKRMHADIRSADWVLDGGTYFISMQVLTYFGDTYWYYHLATGDNNPTGSDRMDRDPGEQPDVNHGGEFGFGPFPGAYGYNDFTPAGVVHPGTAGDSIFKIEATAIPTPGALSLLCIAGLLRRHHDGVAVARGRRRRRLAGGH